MSSSFTYLPSAAAFNLRYSGKVRAVQGFLCSSTGSWPLFVFLRRFAQLAMHNTTNKCGSSVVPKTIILISVTGAIFSTTLIASR